MLELSAWVRRHSEPALEPALPIIDPHHHLWVNDTGTYLLDELLADLNTGHNIVATVFIEAGSFYRTDGPVEMRPIGEVEVANGVAAMSASGRYGNSRLCAGIVGHADLTLGDAVKPVLEALIAAGNGRLRGIRYGLPWDSGNARSGNKKRPPPPRHLALDPTFRRGIACLHPLGLSFEAWMFFHQLPELADLLRAFPDTSVILNHVGGILGIAPHDGKRDQVFAAWRNNIRELAQYPNLTIKVGGLAMTHCGWDFHRRENPPSSQELAAEWRPYVETCIETFGPARCMMESNFPAEKQSCGYGALWNAMKIITRDCSAAEKAALYHDTAARVYRIPGN
jgi:L-fuconolactonase